MALAERDSRAQRAEGNVTIVGGSAAGLLTAAKVAQGGRQVRVLESKPDFEPASSKKQTAAEPPEIHAADLAVSKTSPTRFTAPGVIQLHSAPLTLFSAGLRGSEVGQARSAGSSGRTLADSFWTVGALADFEKTISTGFS